MGKFVYFTSAEKRQANEVDLPSFLLDRGEKLIMAGRDYRLVSAPVIKCKKTPRKKCRFVAERRKKR